MKFKEIFTSDINRCLKADIEVKCLDRAEEKVIEIAKMPIHLYLPLVDAILYDETNRYSLYACLKDGQEMPEFKFDFPFTSDDKEAEAHENV